MVAAVIAFAASAATTYGVGMAVGLATGGAAILGVGVGAIVGNIAGAAVFQALTPTPEVQSPAAAADQGAVLNTASTVAALPVVYGRRRLGGVSCLLETSGDGHEYLHLVLAHCEGTISAIDHVTFNYIPTSDARFTGLFEIAHHMGADDQAADATLVGYLPGIWTTDHKLSGVAYTRIRFSYDRNAFQGLPTVAVEIAGRLVYDPRTSTTAWSDNPALAIRDYLTNVRYGRGIPASEIDDTSIIAAANYCDQLVTTPGGDAKRYTCNMVLDTDTNTIDNLQALLTTCRGTLIRTGEKYRLRVDSPGVATQVFDETNITGAWRIDLASKRNRFNRVRATWIDPARSWQQAIHVADSTAYRTADNGVLLEAQISLTGTTDAYQAQALAERVLRQSRSTTTVQFHATIAGLLAQVGDVIAVSHATPGWTDKPFRIVRVGLLSTDEVEITATEYDAAVYDTVPLTAPATAPTTSLPDPSQIAAPTSLTLASESITQPSGAHLLRLNASWTAPASAWVDGYDVAWSEAGGPWDTSRTQDTRFSIPVAIGREYEVRVRSRSVMSGVTSAWATSASATSTAPTTAPASPTASATGALFSVGLVWAFGDSRNDIRATEVWFSGTNDRTVASRLTSEPFPARAYQHPGLNPGQGGYYWLRVMDVWGNASAWYPTSATGGLHAVASADPSALLAQLQGSLGMDQLAAELATPIAMIDTVGPADAPGGLLALARTQATRLRALDRAADTLAESITRVTTTLDQHNHLIRGAGIYVSEADGTVKIEGYDRVAERVTAAEIAVDGVAASISLKASVSYVDDQIALAVLDPSQIADMSGLSARMTSAEADIDGLAAAVTLRATSVDLTNAVGRITTAEADIDALQVQITLKASNTDLDTLTGRVSTAETTLSALDVPAITQTVSDVRYLARDRDADAETLLRAILTGEQVRTQADVALAFARQEITAHVDEGLTAEATARLALAAQVAGNAAAIQTEQTARANADSSLASSITTVQSSAAAAGSAAAAAQATADGAASAAATNAAAIQTEQTARANADSSLASSITTVQSSAAAAGSAAAAAQATADGAASAAATNAAAIQTVDTARANGDSSLASSISTVQASAAAAGAAAAAAQSTADGAASAASTNAAAIQTVDTARANGDSSLASSISTVQARLDTGDFATVKTTAETTATALGGVEAKWGVQVQAMADGTAAVAGIQLLAGTDGESVFAILADRLLIYKPDGTGTPKQIVTLGTINGASALGLDGNLIVDGSVYARHLAADSVTAEKINVDALSAVSATLGAVDVGDSGHLRGGQTDFNTGNGFFLGESENDYKFSVGNSGNKLTWNGESLEITNGDLTRVFNIGAVGTAPILKIGSVLSILGDGTASFGNILADGEITVSTAGHIKGGRTDYNTGTGFFLGYETGAYRFAVGSTTEYLKWDGSTLEIAGNVDDKRHYSVGDIVIASETGHLRLNSNSTTYAEYVDAAGSAITFQTGRAGVVRVGVYLASSYSGNSVINVKVYKNGSEVSAFNCSFFPPSNPPVNGFKWFTTDISGLVAGDKLTIYFKPASTYNASIKGVRFSVGNIPATAMITGAA